MDEKKLFILNTDTNKKKGDTPKEKECRSFSFHTNPILKEMLIKNVTNKKGKFSLKDLFR